MTTNSANCQEPAHEASLISRALSIFGIIAVLILGLALRLVHLGDAPYWHDEITNLIKSDHIKAYLLYGEYESNHPPLFATLLWAWRAVGLGHDEGSMRMLNVVLGLCGIAAIYALGRRLWGARAGLFAAFLLAISPFHITHSQDLKEYMVLPFTAIVMVHCLYVATEKNRPYQWVLYALSAAVACYSEAFAALILVGVNGWFLLQLRGRRDRLPGWLLANLAGALAFLPWLGIMLQKANNIMIQSQSWWVPKPTFYGLMFYFKTIAFGYSDLNPHFKVAMVLFGGAAGVGVWLAFRRDWRSGLLLVMWLTPPLALVYIISLYTQSIFLIRTMMPFGLPVFLWVGLALAQPRSAVIRTLLLVLFAGIAAFPLYQKYTGQFSAEEYPHRPGTHPPVQYKQATDYILAQWKEGDIVLQTGAAGWLPMYWYGLKEYQYSVGVDSGFIHYILDGNPRIQHDTAFDHYFVGQLQPIVEGKTRAWMVLSEWERQFLPGNAKSVWRWMDSHYREIDHQAFDGFEVFLYAKGTEENPIEVTQRDQDDGVCSKISYSGSPETTYLKCLPDANIHYAPPEKRRGNLTLRFSSGGADSGSLDIDLAHDADAQTVGFELENRSGQDVQADICVLASDLLFDLASLYETDVDSDVWTVSPMISPAPPGTYELPVLEANLSGEASASLYGVLRLEPGAYDSFVYSGAPLTPGPQRPEFELRVGNVDLLANTNGREAASEGWQWHSTGEVTVSRDREQLPVSLTARSRKDQGEMWGRVAYLALRKQAGEGPLATASDPPEFWRGPMEIPSKTLKHAVLRINRERRRIDIWVFERGQQGKVYRIYRVRQ